MVTELTVDAPDGAAEAYLAGEEGRPGVLFFMDAFGLRPRISDMVERIAGWGYTVLAPNVFYREGSAADLAPTGTCATPRHASASWPPARSSGSGATRPISPARTPRRGSMRSARTPGPARSAPPATAWERGSPCALPGCSPSSVAAVGGWHGGGLVTDAPDSPHRGIASSTAAYAFGHADQDRSMPADAVVALGETPGAGRPPVRQRGLRRCGARLHDGRHRGLRRGRGRAPLPRASRPPRREPAPRGGALRDPGRQLVRWT